MNRSTLTPRELDVLQLIVRGKSNKEIASDLKVGEETVKYHVKGILGKLGVEDRTQAATAALLRGIVHPQEL
jgi:two-component system NarL family response regulator